MAFLKKQDTAQYSLPGCHMEPKNGIRLPPEVTIPIDREKLDTITIDGMSTMLENLGALMKDPTALRKIEMPMVCHRYKLRGSIWDAQREVTYSDGEPELNQTTEKMGTSDECNQEDSD